MNEQEIAVLQDDIAKLGEWKSVAQKLGSAIMHPCEKRGAKFIGHPSFNSQFRRHLMEGLIDASYQTAEDAQNARIKELEELNDVTTMAYGLYVAGIAGALGIEAIDAETDKDVVGKIHAIDGQRRGLFMAALGLLMATGDADDHNSQIVRQSLRMSARNQTEQQLLKMIRPAEGS